MQGLHEANGSSKLFPFKNQISLGLNRDVFVRIDASPEIYGRFEDEFELITKHQIYKIPIHANIMDGPTFDRLD